MELCPSWEPASCSASQELSPTFYGTWRFINMFTRALQWSVSRARWIHESIPSHPISLRSILILSSHGWEHIWKTHLRHVPTKSFKTVCLLSSICLSATSQESLKRFSWNQTLENVTKVCQHLPVLIKSGWQCAKHVKIYMHFCMFFMCLKCNSPDIYWG
jgi:hypothetical protein